ncbi:MAG: DUF456 domain-containing protein [Actinomycetota bacterium]|nr:DUF456 domain-containing protein [Actinomycetota bacterium]
MEAVNGLPLWISLAAMLVGLEGAVVPGLPGVPLIFLSALVYAYLTGFEVVSGWIVALLGLFAALALVADYVATTYGARRFGASWAGTIGGAVGGIVGTLAGALFFGIGAFFGLILGTIGGVFLGEYLKRRERGPGSDAGQRPSSDRGDWRRASRAAGGVFVGYIASAIAQGILGLIGVIVFILALFY